MGLRLGPGCQSESYAKLKNQKPVKKPAIARRYDVSERTIQAWMDERKIPFVKIGYMVRFDAEACVRALARFNVSSAALESCVA